MTLFNKFYFLVIVSLVTSLLFSCGSSEDGIDQNFDDSPAFKINSGADTLPDLTLKQQSAFDALNSIQSQGQHLYSTFSGIHHNCFPPDTNFVISQADLLNAINVLLEKHYSNINAEERIKLAQESVLAQEEYVVLQCFGNSEANENVKNKNIPNSGTWILPEILGRRDLVIKWKILI